MTDGSAPRVAEIPIKPRDVRLDYLFLTHDHADHTDPHSAPQIAQANPEAVIVCPPSSARHLTKLGVPSNQIQTAMPGQAIEFRSFVAHVAAAQHTEDSVGYVFEFSDGGSEADNVAVYIDRGHGVQQFSGGGGGGFRAGRFACADRGRGRQSGCGAGGETGCGDCAEGSDSNALWAAGVGDRERG